MDRKCNICKKLLEHFDGTIKDGVIEIGEYAFCSEKCYKIFKTRNHKLFE